MGKYASLKQPYYIEMPNGTIQFNDDYVPFLNYLFAQVGIHIKTIKTP